MSHSLAFQTTKKALTSALSLVSGAVDAKSSMPILGSVLLMADADGRVRASGTDLFMVATAEPDANVTSVSKHGACVVPMKETLQRVKALDDGIVTISAQDVGTVEISGGGQTFRIRGTDSEDFPALPQVSPNAGSFTMRAEVLLGLLESVAFSISQDETRPHLNSLLFEKVGTIIRLVATDGHRLSKVERVIPLAGPDCSMLLPLQFVRQLTRMCKAVASKKRAKHSYDEPGASITITPPPPVETVKASASKPSNANAIEANAPHRNAHFKNCTSAMSVRTVDATFPPYGQVIPAHAHERMTHAFRTNRAALIKALKSVAIAANERTGAIKLFFGGFGGTETVKITAENPDTGDASASISVRFAQYDASKEFAIGFNVRYLLDALDSMDTETVALCIEGDLDPCVLLGTGDEGILHLVMPMRI